MAIFELLVQPGTVHLAVVDHHIERDAGEAFLEGGLDAVLLVGRVAAGIDGQGAPFLQRLFVDFIQGAGFDFRRPGGDADETQGQGGQREYFFHDG